MDTISGYSGKSYEKIVQKKDPGSRENGVHGARDGTAPSPKRSGTRPVRCPFMFRSIVKRHAMTGSRLGRYAETRPAPGFWRGRVGPGPSGRGADPFDWIPSTLFNSDNLHRAKIRSILSAILQVRQWHTLCDISVEPEFFNNLAERIIGILFKKARACIPTRSAADTG